MKFNIGGYICPQFLAAVGGLGSVIMVKVVHPALAKASSPLPMKVLVPADAVLVFVCGRPHRLPQPPPPA